MKEEACVCPLGQTLDEQLFKCRSVEDAGNPSDVPEPPDAPAIPRAQDAGPAAPPPEGDASPQPDPPSTTPEFGSIPETDGASPRTDNETQPERSSNADAGSPSDYCDDGNDDPYDACVNHRAATCGDGALHIGKEECEPGFGEGWTKENCVECKRARYEVCERFDDCWEHRTMLTNGEVRPDICIDGVCVPTGCDNGEICSVSCPPLGGYDVQLRGIYCLLGCNGDGACPTGLVCTPETEFSTFRHCVGPGYVAEP